MKIPLSQLRAFEAAARHESFTLAAETIGITQSAVSQQIRTLELRLECSLFNRSHRSVELTREGEMLAAALVQAFQQIDSAVDALTTLGGEKGVVHLVIFPTHARRILIPRLEKFYAEHTGIQVQITAAHWISRRPVGADLAVRNGFGGWPGVKSVRLHSATLTPVCSPAYLERHPLNRLEDLNDAVLLESQNRLDDWPFWRNSVPNDLHRPNQCLIFGNSDLTYEAALSGIGVALGQVSLVLDDLVSGKLVAPFPVFPQLDSSVFLLMDENAPAHVKTFVDWFAAEIAAVERDVSAFIRRAQAAAS